MRFGPAVMLTRLQASTTSSIVLSSQYRLIDCFLLFLSGEKSLPIRVLLSSFASSYALIIMEVFPVFGQVERKHAGKYERIILAGSNIDAIGLRQAEPLL
jgi:hypothetical protein